VGKLKFFNKKEKTNESNKNKNKIKKKKKKKQREEQQQQQQTLLAEIELIHEEAETNFFNTNFSRKKNQN
jgi:hypothetical protein